MNLQPEIVMREVHVHRSNTLSRTKVDGVCRTTQSNKKKMKLHFVLLLFSQQASRERPACFHVQRRLNTVKLRTVRITSPFC